MTLLPARDADTNVKSAPAARSRDVELAPNTIYSAFNLGLTSGSTSEEGVFVAPYDCLIIGAYANVRTAVTADKQITIGNDSNNDAYMTGFTLTSAMSNGIDLWALGTWVTTPNGLILPQGATLVAASDNAATAGSLDINVLLERLKRFSTDPLNG